MNNELIAKNFGKNLKYLRELNGYEQSEIARIVNRKSTSTISEWEKGLRLPAMQNVQIISLFFNVSISDILYKDLSNSTNEVVNESVNESKVDINNFDTDTKNFIHSFIKTKEFKSEIETILKNIIKEEVKKQVKEIFNSVNDEI